MQDEVIEHRFTPSEIIELVQNKRSLAFFTEASDWPAFDEFREDAENAGLVTGECRFRWTRRHKPSVQLKTLFMARPEGAWRFAKAAFVVRTRNLGRLPDIDWPDRVLADLMGRSPVEVAAYLRRERRAWQISRLQRLRKQRKRRFTPRSW
jgi:hypothetical protein